MKRLTKIELRKQNEQKRDLAIKAAFAASNEAAKANPRPMSKRLATDALQRYLPAIDWSEQVVRTDGSYEARSYNKGRQLIDLIAHRYVRYPLPIFLYRTMLNRRGLAETFEAFAAEEFGYAAWFFALAKGESFIKKAQETLSRREANLFIDAPSTNSVKKNIWWAKLVAAGCTEKAAGWLLQSFTDVELGMIGKRAGDFALMLARTQADWPAELRVEILQMLQEIVYNAEFSFKGRTASSLAKMAKEWKKRGFKGKLTKLSTWDTHLTPWSSTYKDYAVVAVELNNNRLLAEEGSRQRNCVYSYQKDCERGESGIVSMRWYKPGAANPSSRVTIEFEPQSRSIVQIRSSLNRDPSAAHMESIRRWASKVNLKIAERLC